MATQEMRMAIQSSTLNSKLAGSHGVQELFKEDTQTGVENSPQDPDLLYFAALYDQESIAKYLLSKGCNPNRESSAGLLPLQVANCPIMIDLLIANKANINARSSNGQTPLHHAVCHASEEVVAHLLAQGADPYAGPDTPLEHLIKSKLTREHSSAYQEGNYSEDYEVAQNTNKVIKLLLDAAPDLILSNSSFLDLVYYFKMRDAYSKRHPRYFEGIQDMLRALKKSLLKLNNIAEIIVLKAKEWPHAQIVETLIPTRPTDDELESPQYRALLYYAVQYDQKKIAQYLLEKCFNSKGQGPSGLLPHQIATPSMMDLLKEYGANIRAADSADTQLTMPEVHSLMHHTLSNFSKICNTLLQSTRPIINLYLDYQIDPDCTDEEKLNLEKYLKIAKQLADINVDINSDINKPYCPEAISTSLRITDYLHALKMTTPQESKLRL